MSFRSEYKKRFETPAEILYCPYCAVSSDEWETVYYSKHHKCIVGCDACIMFSDEVETCPICGAKEQNLYKDKTTTEAVGCDKCIELLGYDTCLEYYKEEML